ncbi:YybH family protein [Candidatus Binatus sp.]|uniref:YybH family protein n=1 Tax=Candidatus Binatus sp. TaxID=2811406 RepID=UPI002F959374
MRMKRARVGAFTAGVLALLMSAAYAPAARADSTTAAGDEIRAELEKWTRDFNSGDASEVCSLFAPDLISNYRGEPEDTYTSLCANLQMALADTAKTYHYDLEIKEIIVSGDLAVVRLVWTLKVRPKNGPEETKRELGLDIFRRQPDGSWKIARYMAYEAPYP